MSRRGFVAVKRFTCPNHPGGPPNLPASGWEYDELTLEEGYEPEEVAALRAVAGAARTAGHPQAETVRAMFGLCCEGHKWKIVGFRALTRSEVTMAQFVGVLRDFTPPPLTDSILLAELSRFDVELQAGSQLPVRIPLIREGVSIHGEPLQSTVTDSGPMPPLHAGHEGFASGIEIVDVFPDRDTSTDG